MLISDVVVALEEFAPPALQEDYDNSGLQVGEPGSEVTGILFTLDVTPESVDEAVARKCNLIVSHHPLLFRPIKKLTEQGHIGRVLTMAVRERISIYAAHTSLDSVSRGVSAILAEKLGLRLPRILAPRKGLLRKLVTFCPPSHAEAVRNALFSAGAGHIGQYDSCSFNSPGQGSFRALQGTSPYVGRINEIHTEDEVKIETVFPSWLESPVLNALFMAHPYEEVAFDIVPLENVHYGAGYGMLAELETSMETQQFLEFIKKRLEIPVLRHSAPVAPTVRKIALSGGAGSFLLKEALASGADAYLTADLKYHDFFMPEGKLILVDIGHYESERHSLEVIHTVLKEKFPNFANFIYGRCTNAVHYF